MHAGGHDVPPERLERRFRQSLENLRRALTFVPETNVIDNSFAEDPFRLVLKVLDGKFEKFADPLPRWLGVVDPSKP